MEYSSYPYTRSFSRKFVCTKRVLGPPKSLETRALCSTKIKKLYNINLSKREYFALLPLVNLYDLCLKKTVTCDFDLLGRFSLRSTGISTQTCSTLNDRVSFGLKIRN